MVEDLRGGHGGRNRMGGGGDGGEEGRGPDCARSVSSIRNSTFILNEVKRQLSLWFNRVSLLC